MVGKAKACKGGGQLTSYITKEQKGYELDRNLLSGETPQEISGEMQVIQDLNTDPRAQNKSISLVLSPTIEDGQKLTDEELREMTREFMNKLGIDPKQQQFIAYVHTNKEHKHVHVLANRVKMDGKMISDKYIGKRAQQAAHDIAIERELTTVREVQRERNLTKEMTRKKMFRTHKEVMRQNPLSLEDYRGMMSARGVEVIPTINKQGKLQGHNFRDMATGTKMKASDVHRSLGLKNLIEQGLPVKNERVLPKLILPAHFRAIKLVARITKNTISLSISH